MLRGLLFWLEMLTFLLAVAVVLSSPVLLVTFVSRRRMHPTLARTILALSFAAAVAFQIWRMEWFDVWRHGFPGVPYLFTAFLPYMAVFAAIGWLVGGRMVRRRRNGCAEGRPS